MPAPGSTPILIYNSSTASQVPLAANLSQGELAINVTDKKLYSKDSGGNVILIASSGGDVTGPATSTNLAIPTFSGTTGKLLLNNSGVTITAGVITATGFTGALNGTLGATTPSTVVATSINASVAITGAQGSTYGFIVPNSGAIRSGSNGKLQISADTGNAYADSNISFDIDGNVLATIDASGNVGIGVTPSAWYSTAKAIEIGALGNSVYGNGGASIHLTSNAYYSAVSTWKYGITGSAAGRYELTDGISMWFTAPSGTAGNAITFTQAMTLNASGGLQTLNTIGVGNATPSASGAGITFPATQSASTDANTLDDYEEGTWTPAVTFSGGNGDLAYATRVGTYTKIGRCVSFTLHLVFGETTAAGYIEYIGGLPFAAGSIQAGGGAYIDSFSLLVGGAQWEFETPTSSRIVVYMSGTGNATVIGVASIPAAGAIIILSGIYFTT
jgi:hypothetical protein